MVDINKWYKCNEIKPKRKGKYLLLIGKKAVVGGWMEITTLLSSWNGHIWDIPEDHLPMQWKYVKNTI